MFPVFQPYDYLLDFEITFGDLKDILKEFLGIAGRVNLKQFCHG